MRVMTNEAQLHGEFRIGPAPFLRSHLLSLMHACILASATTACSAQIAHAQTTPSQTVPIADKPSQSPLATPAPNANAPVITQQQKQQDLAQSNADPQSQLSNDIAKLLKLATDLRAEVDKTDKDTLSVNVIRKADEIERLAHGVKEKMKPSVGSN